MSTQAKHTPGPWYVSGDKILATRTKDGCESTLQWANVVGKIGGVPYGPPDEDKANAQLIGAAPEMLAALRVTLHRAEQARHSSEQLGPIAAEWLDGIISEARAAIAKAEGRAGE